MTSPRRRHTVTKILAAGIAIAGVGLLALVPATSASAHNYLVSSTPAPDSVQTQPLDAVTLEFNDIVLKLGTNTSFVEVTGPDGASTHFETGCPVTQDRTVAAPVALGPAGSYLIVWQIVSADGHTVSDTQTFTYQPPAGTTAASGSSTPPCPSSETPADSTPAPNTATSAPANVTIVIWIAVGIVVLALIGVVIVLVASRRSKRRSDNEEDSGGEEGSGDIQDDSRA